jgi:ribosomal protein S18 acetylase RimI-like enzyme
LVVSSRNIFEVTSEFLEKHLVQFYQLDKVELGQESWTLKNWEKSLDDTGYKLFCCLSKDEELIGFILVHSIVQMQQAHLLKIVIASPFKRLGIANKMFILAMEDLARLGVNNCYLEVGIDNFSAIALYRSLAFTILTTKKKFYKSGKSAYAMQCFFGGLPQLNLSD